MKRFKLIFLVAMAAVIINITVLAASASASGGGEELRRVDTSNVNEAAGETVGAAEEEEHHAPAWMIPGWQSIFTVLAVIYFGLGVTFLPRVMAKEEH